MWAFSRLTQTNVSLERLTYLVLSGRKDLLRWSPGFSRILSNSIRLKAGLQQPFPAERTYKNL